MVIKHIRNSFIIVLCISIGASSAELPQVLTKFVPKNNFFLPIGTILPTTTTGAIFSFNVEAPVVATLDEPVICPKNNEIILPKGTRLIGNAGIIKSDDRVNINFYLAVLPSPSGYQIPIKGIALSSDGTGGLKGVVKEYKQAKYVSSVASGAMIGLGQVAVNTPGVNPVVGNAMGNVMQTGSNDVSQNAVKIDVSITVPPYQKCSIFLLDEIILDKEPVKVSKSSKDDSHDDSVFDDINISKPSKK